MVEITTRVHLTVASLSDTSDSPNLVKGFIPPQINMNMSKLWRLIGSGRPQEQK